MLIYLAGVLSIPKDWYEAAEIDGADVWARIKYITLPSMRNLIILMLILQVRTQSWLYPWLLLVLLLTLWLFRCTHTLADSTLNNFQYQ